MENKWKSHVCLRYVSWGENKSKMFEKRWYVKLSSDLSLLVKISISTQTFLIRSQLCTCSRTAALVCTSRLKIFLQTVVRSGKCCETSWWSNETEDDPSPDKPPSGPETPEHFHQTSDTDRSRHRTSHLHTSIHKHVHIHTTQQHNTFDTGWSSTIGSLIYFLSVIYA